MLRRKEKERSTKLEKARDQLTNSASEGELAPMIEQKDLDFLAQTKVPELTQRDILKMYVGNWSQLNLVQRRKVMGYVQA